MHLRISGQSESGSRHPFLRIPGSLSDLIIDLNAEIEERETQGTPFDYKRELKSPSAVRGLASDILPMYEKTLKRGRVSSFSEEWHKTADQG